MKRLVLAIATLSTTASAEPTLHEFGTGVPDRAATDLVETSCDVDLVMTGAIVTGELRERVKNGGPEALGASLDLDLPRGATVTGYAVAGESAVRVPAISPEAFGNDVIEADPGIVVELADGSFRAIVQPIEPNHEAAITTRFVVRADVRDGALRVVMPGRAATAGACRGMIRAVGGPGATVDKLRVDGLATGARGTAAFAVDTRDVALDVGLAFARPEPLVWTQSESLGEGWTATIATVLAPPTPPTARRAARVLFVIDSSRSMELVGRANVAKVIHAISASLPASTAIEGIAYDRTATRLLGSWQSVAKSGELERAIAQRPTSNGTDLPAALRLAAIALADGPAHTPTAIVVVTDGMLPELADKELVGALDRQAPIDVHVIALEPGHEHAASTDELRRPIDAFGGSFVEVSVDELDSALAGADGWLRSSWVDVSLAGARAPELAPQLRAGSGTTIALIDRAAPAFVLGARLTAPMHAQSRALPGIGAAALALADSDPTALLGKANDDASDAERKVAGKLRERLERAHPIVTPSRMLAVLASHGKVALHRREMIAGGGPYTRILAFEDPARETNVVMATVAPTASAIAQITLERMFREQLQPRAFACYQRALGTAPTLTGIVTFDFHMARGEVTRATLAGLDHAGFDACLLDAAYTLAPPLPDFSINADDQTIAHYPLSFRLADNKPTVVLGDADSRSPIDIEKLTPGVPERKRPVKVDTATPLGKLRP